MRIRYIHGFETYKVDSISQQNGGKILNIGRHKVEVHPECQLKEGATLDIYSAANMQTALAQKAATVLIHSNPIATCEKCPFLGKGCKSGAVNALEDLGGFLGFKTEI
jgi:hypothetical protein